MQTKSPLAKAKERKSDFFPGCSTEGTGERLFNDTTACKNKKEWWCPHNGAICRDTERDRDGNATKQNNPSSVPPPLLHPPMNQLHGAKHITCLQQLQKRALIKSQVTVRGLSRSQEVKSYRSALTHQLRSALITSWAVKGKPK